MQIILKIVNRYLNVPVIIAEQDKQRPKCDFVSMYFIGLNSVGRNEKITDKCGLMKFGQKYNLEICFDCIGKNAYEIALKIANMWPLTCVQEELKNANISWHKNLSPRNTSDVFGEMYVSRVSLESLFYIEMHTYEQQYIIEKVNLDGLN